jgi:hypothetical protein
VDDDRTQKAPSQPKNPDPFEVLHNALFDVLLERDQLSMAVQQQDAEDAVISANEAARSWLCARAALQRIKAREMAAREQTRHAERAIHASHGALVDQLDRAVTQIAASSLRRMLEQLKRSLLVANDESLLKEISIRGGAAPSDVERPQHDHQVTTGTGEARR